jgi:hypothetical protein
VRGVATFAQPNHELQRTSDGTAAGSPLNSVLSGRRAMARAIRRSTAIVSMLLVFQAAVSCDWMCSYEPMDELASPDGRYVARVMWRNCHATVPYSTVLRLHDRRAHIFDTKDVRVAGCGTALRLRWRAASVLEVEYPRACGYDDRCMCAPEDSSWGAMAYHIRPSEE